MKFGFYADNQLPESVAKGKKPISDYNVNSHGYRCPEWNPLPEGKKNVVILGCSHTFGEGLNDGQVWVDKLYNKVDQKRLRFWNLGQPGASADKVVRILYGTEKVLFPKLIIVCWPFWSRRERLDTYAKSLLSYDETLKNENEKNKVEETPKEMIAFDDFTKMDLKTGTILEAEKMAKINFGKPKVQRNHFLEKCDSRTKQSMMNSQNYFLSR